MSDLFDTKGHSAVMSMRVEEADGLDDFPTPCWATRALIERVLWPSARENLKHMTCWEPACGRRIMSDVLEESFQRVIATDVASYATVYNRAPDAICSYLTLPPPAAYHWMITNPPFNRAKQFVLKALQEARCGVAVLVRSVWLESAERYNELFQPFPPTLVAQFVERVPMIKGVWNPKASSATGYSWVVWDTEMRRQSGSAPKLVWIPPGTRTALTKPEDAETYSYRGLTQWLNDQLALNGRRVLVTPAGDTKTLRELEDEADRLRLRLVDAHAHERAHIDRMRAA